MDLVSLREFARRKGVSLQAVQNGIKSLRVTPVRDASGKCQGLDWDTEAAKWDNNANPGKKQSAEVRHNIQPQKVVPKATAPKTRGRPAKAPTEPREGEPNEQAPQSAEVLASKLFAVSRSRKEKALADSAELARDEQLKLLVRADQVKLEWMRMVKAAQTKILGIPSKCKNKIPGINIKTIQLIEEACREALEEMADGAE
jgi:hypothetical protein